MTACSLLSWASAWADVPSPSPVPDCYLLVTDAPYFRAENGQILVGRQWAQELKQLVSFAGPVRVLAPEAPVVAADTEPVGFGITFRTIPELRAGRSLAGWWSMRRVLHEEVEAAGVVHTCCVDAPHMALTQAHDLAVRLGKTTLLVTGTLRRFR